MINKNDLASVPNGSAEWIRIKDEGTTHRLAARTFYGSRTLYMAEVTRGGVKDVITIDFAGGVRSPNSPAGICFYKRIEGSRSYVITSKEQGKTYYFIYGEEMAAKGGDEVASILRVFFRDYLSPQVTEVVANCDGTAGQVWNTTNLYQFQMFVTPGSPVFLARLQYLLVFRNEVGHTYMPADTESGKMTASINEYLRTHPAVHTFLESNCKDAIGIIPGMISAESLARKIPSYVVVPLAITDFVTVTESFFASKIFDRPTPPSCSCGPHKFIKNLSKRKNMTEEVTANVLIQNKLQRVLDWKISNSHSWEFKQGTLVFAEAGTAAPARTEIPKGQVYTRNSLLQKEADVVTITTKLYNSNLELEYDWEGETESHVKRLLPSIISFKKAEDLHHVFQKIAPNDRAKAMRPHPGTEKEYNTKYKDRKILGDVEVECEVLDSLVQVAKSNKPPPLLEVDGAVGGGVGEDDVENGDEVGEGVELAGAAQREMDGLRVSRPDDSNP